MKVKEFQGNWYGRRSDLEEELMDEDIEINEANDEYISVTDLNEDDEEAEFILYLEHANSTVWINWVREM